MHGARRAVGVGCVSLLLVAWTGCASRSPDRQDFVEVRTQNFILTSSLSPEKSVAFARSLEFFHAGVRSLLGPADDLPAPAPARVIVFDDRSLGRPFAVQNEAAYLLDEVEAPILVFRGGRDFSARATPALRDRYAQRLLRDHAREEYPLWYELGVSQLASSISESGDGIVVGRLLAESRVSILDWRSSELLSTFQRFDLSDMTDPQRVRFEAQSWAIAHTLEFSDAPASGSNTLLDRYRRALESRDAGQRERAFSAIGLSPEALEKRIYTHLEKRRPKLRALEFWGFDTSKLAVVPLSRAESRSRLGELALRLGRPELAATYFDGALRDDPKHVGARIGRATAAAELDQVDLFDSIFASLTILPDAPAAIQIAVADAHRAVAPSRDSPTRRKAELATARQQYADALRLPELAARAQLGMALSYLEVDGEDPAEAFKWIEAARQSRRGSLLLELRLAQAEAKSGSSKSAQIRVRNVLSRTRDPILEKEARTVLEALDGAGS